MAQSNAGVGAIVIATIEAESTFEKRSYANCGTSTAFAHAHDHRNELSTFGSTKIGEWEVLKVNSKDLLMEFINIMYTFFFF